MLCAPGPMSIPSRCMWSWNCMFWSSGVLVVMWSSICCVFSGKSRQHCVLLGCSCKLAHVAVILKQMLSLVRVCGMLGVEIPMSSQNALRVGLCGDVLDAISLIIGSRQYAKSIMESGQPCFTPDRNSMVL